MKLGLPALLAAALVAAACSDGTGRPPPDDDVPTDTPDGGDAGTPDPVDAGDDGGSPEDGGTDAGVPIELTIRTVTPPRGPLAGGTIVVLQGRGFVEGFADFGGQEASDQTEISFGGNTAIDVNVIDDDTIEVRSPAGARGDADVVLKNPNGTFTCEKCFTYFEAVTLARVTPNQGSALGGDEISITGSGFIDGVLVLVGGSEAADVVVAEDGRSLTARTPPGTPGSADVGVVGANSSAFLRRGFVYVAPVSVTALEPAFADVGQTPEVTVRGTGFTADAKVEVDGVAATNVRFVSATELKATFPAAAAPGTSDVRVVQRRGEGTLTDAFAWLDPDVRDMQLVSVSPRTGSTQGGTCADGPATCLTLTGAGFAGGELSVKIGPNSATVHAIDDHAIQVDLPAGAPGVVDVQVRGARGSARLANAFGYVVPIVLSKLDPAKGDASGTPAVTSTLTGAGLSADCDYRIGTNAATVVSVNTAGTEAVLTVPPGAPGARDLVVTCGDDATFTRQQATLTGAFTYTTPLELRSIDPQTGAIAGNTLVTLYGSGFQPGMDVLFGRTKATALEVVSPHVATVRTPKGEPGTVDVTVATGFLTQDVLRGGFAFYDPTNALGGASGGPMAGTLNVTVLNSTPGMSGPVDGVTVSINNDQLIGVTDLRGQVTFSDPALLKPVTITTKKPKFAASTIARVDARNVTIFMQMNEGEPADPSFPPGPEPAIFRGRVCGFKLPAGRTLGPQETTEARVYFTSPYVYAAPPFANPPAYATVFKDCDSKSLYELRKTRGFGPLAVYAEWGIVDNSQSPPLFTPLLMGIRRGLEATPGKTIENLDIVLDMHRDVDFPVKVIPAAPPPGGLVMNMVFSYLDLGGEGVVPLAVTESLTDDFVFENHPRVGGEGLIFLNFSGILDILTFDVTPPYSLFYRRQYGDLSAGVEIGPMLAFTQLETPASGGAFTGALSWSFTEGVRPDLQQIYVEQPMGLSSKPIWDIILPGSEEGVVLPPTVQQTLEHGAFMQWTVITAKSPRFDYNRFGYQQLGVTAWTAFTQDGGIFVVP